MPIDPRIPLGFQAPQIELPDPLGTQMAGMRLADMVNARRMREAEQQRAQRIRGAYVTGPDGRVDRRATLANLGRVDPEMAMEFENGLATQEAAAAEKQAKAQEAERKRQADEFAFKKQVSEDLGQKTAALLAEEDPAKRQALWQTTRAGLNPEWYGNEIPEELPDESYLAQIMMQALPVEKQRELAIRVAKEQRDAEAAQIAADTARMGQRGAELSLAGQMAPQDAAIWTEWRAGLSPGLQKRIPAEYSPEAAAAVERMSMPVKERRELEAAAETAAERERHNRAMENKPAASSAIVLSPEGIDVAARVFAQTGTMPSLGMGASGARAQIINRAAELDPEVNIGANKAAYDANRGALLPLRKSYSAVRAFKQTAMKNLDLLIETAKPLMDAKSPLLNMPLRQFEQRAAGSPELAAYEAARRVAVNEVARVTSNPNLVGVLSDSAREEVESFIPSEATFNQLLHVVKVLKQDMTNRDTSILDEIQAIEKRLGISPSEGRESKEQPSKRPPLSSFGT